MLNQRRSGILLHPTSLPGPQPIGSLGAEAYAFVNFLVAAGQSVWQVLPLGPVGYGNCPYSCFSAFAGNPALISLASLVEQGDLKKSDLPTPCPPSTVADFSLIEKKIAPPLEVAGRNFFANTTGPRLDAYARFCQEQSHWLDDYALFETLRAMCGRQPWTSWPEPLRKRDPDALKTVLTQQHESIRLQQYLQFVFFEQWGALKNYAREKGIKLFGDLPIFVAADSADVWARQDMFYLRDDGQPKLVTGVPPDYFSTTGQRWGNPLYDWEHMSDDDFSWWRARFEWNLRIFDLLRIDHFRGFSACWAIPAELPTAESGEWLPTPGYQLFDRLHQQFKTMPIIAEDLGIITPDVIALRDHYGFPGMKILQFAFDSGPDNPYLPHNLTPNAVIYTGTHDNNTTLGWWQALDAGGKDRVRSYLRQPCREMPWPLIETALASVCNLAVIPMQDLLALPSTSRMNTPGTAVSNWQWRLSADADLKTAERLRKISHLYGRDLCNATEI